MARTFSKRWWLGLGLAAVVGSVAACGDDTGTPPPTIPGGGGGAGGGGGTGGGGGAIDAGTDDAGTGPSAARGQAVFAEHCVVCHPGGGAGVGPSLIDSQATPEQMRVQIRNGGGGMPPYPPSIIPDPELEDLIAYLMQLQMSQ